MAKKRITKSTVAAIVRKHGGTIEDAGSPDDWNIMSPLGYWWKEAGVRCYPLPLGECDSKEERQDLLREAMEMLAEIEPIEDDDRIVKKNQHIGVPELLAALEDISTMASWHCDVDADENDKSPADAAAHVNGLIVQLCNRVISKAKGETV